MALVRAALTEDDVRVLARGEDEEQRAAVAHRLCRRIDAGLDPSERAAAEDILRLMAADAAELVRRALAVTLRSSPDLPRDIALKLAADVDTVAEPLLRFSPVFTDADLAGVIRAAADAKQVAVAQRQTLSQEVAGVLARHGCEAAVRTAAANDNALFDESSLKAAIDRFNGSEAVASAMAYRKALPLSVSERLVGMVSDTVRQHLVDRHGLSPATALQIALGAGERATLDLVDQAGRAADMQAFTRHLADHQRLTPSLVLRALAHGHMSFFEWALATLAETPHHRAWLMIHDAGPLGLRALYERAGLPLKLFPAFRAGVDTYRTLQLEGADLTVDALQERMLQRFLTQASGAGRSDVDYLLDKIDRRPTPMPSDGSRRLIA